jgi:hypothetical protein
MWKAKWMLYLWSDFVKRNSQLGNNYMYITWSTTEIELW